MAKQITIIDDLDGSPASKTVRFSYQGKSYTLDLSEKNASALDKALAPFTVKAKVSATGGADAIRKWAKEHGHTVSAKGRIPAPIRKAYDEANA